MVVADSLTARLRERLPQIQFTEYADLKAQCTFRIGGRARLMCMPKTVVELIALCEFFKQAGVRPFILGRGTNVLFSDGDLDMVIIKTSESMKSVELIDPLILRADSGASLYSLANRAAKESLSGLEFAQGIPGTVGGAVYMNAGAYGGELSQVCVRTRYVDEDMKVQVVEAAAHEFSYRHSRFSDSGDVILDSEFKLREGDSVEIEKVHRELAERRRTSQPLDMPSAGSTFKRPPEGFAAKLIDDCGLKGEWRGGAEVSTKHAGFVVNRGGATFEDVITLMDYVRETVYKASGVMLEPEVRIVR